MVELGPSVTVNGSFLPNPGFGIQSRFSPRESCAAFAGRKATLDACERLLPVRTNNPVRDPCQVVANRLSRPDTS